MPEVGFHWCFRPETGPARLPSWWGRWLEGEWLPPASMICLRLDFEVSVRDLSPK